MATTSPTKPTCPGFTAVKGGGEPPLDYWRVLDPLGFPFCTVYPDPGLTELTPLAPETTETRAWRVAALLNFRIGIQKLEEAIR